MSSTSVIILVVVVLVVLVVVAALVMASRRRALKQRFGPEYDRAVAEGDSRLAAERELRERERRHAKLELRELTPESRERYAASWDQIQGKFVDDPNTAVTEADELVTRLIAERGYPTGDYDEQVANLSVEHARTLGHYRDAHEINLANSRGEATTEQLRQALVHYRELFSDLLGTPRETADTPAGTTTATETVTDRAADRASGEPVVVDETADRDDAFEHGGDDRPALHRAEDRAEDWADDRADAESDAARAAADADRAADDADRAADEAAVRGERNGRADRIEHDTRRP
jgi:hypothetical protein